MKIVKWTEEELAQIARDGCVCFAVAEKAMNRSGIHFDDIECMTDTHENHKWGSDADRKYRQRLVNKAIRMVASDPMKYAYETR